MAEALPRFGFAPAEIERVAAMIMATRMPQSPTNELERLLADADLDALGRPDFLETSKALWRELGALGKPQSWAQWLEFQLRFLRSHRYFTATARVLRNEGKQQNIALVEGLIRDGK
jgi:predicted metal-dependent HD superfamily phosphohydrolase